MCRYLHAGGGSVGPVISIIRCGDPACPHKRPIPMNEAAREQMRKRGEPFDAKASDALQRFFKLDQKP